MTKPFRVGKASTFSSSVWPGLVIHHEEDHLLVLPPLSLDSLSNAVYSGGHHQVDRIVNWKVPRTYDCGDPQRDFQLMLEHWGYKTDSSIGLQTAAVIAGGSVFEEEGDCFRLVVCTTSGTGNAARAGFGREVYSAYQAGTINIVMLIDGRMTFPAMINAIITATEAKAAALQDLGIADAASGLLATGTTTDAVVIAVSQSMDYQQTHAYAGTATTIGDAIGRLVYASVCEASVASAP
ncbi:MAG: adenosylcobinamide amidohydrolase [Gorillibacterium sp.]|nr:adenosylcobinamide amidohydrolase [Gorillibacterium sp.]